MSKKDDFDLDAYKLTEEARQVADAGDFQLGVKKLAEAAKLVRKRLGGRSRMHGDILRIAGSMARVLGDPDRAARRYRQAISLLERAPEGETVSLARALMSLSQIYFSEGKLSEARELRLKGGPILIDKMVSDRNALSALIELAADSEPEEAEQLYAGALSVSTSHEAAPEQFVLLTSLARARLRAGGNVQDLVARALEKLDSLNESELDQIVHFIIVLGDICRVLRRPADAIRVLRLIDKVAGKDPQEQEVRFRGLQALARVHSDENDFDAEQSVLREAISLSRSVFGERDEWTIEALEDLGDSYHAHRRYQEAAEIFEHTANVRLEESGESEQYAESLTQLAQAYDQEGSYAAAQKYYRVALKVFKAKLGPSHRRVAIAVHNIAELDRIREYFSHAESGFLEAIRIQEEVGGEAEPMMALFKNNLSEVYVRMGRVEEATDLLSQALEIRERVFGPSSPEVQRSLLSLATLEARRLNFDSAIVHLQRAKSIEPDNQFDVTNCDWLIAQCLTGKEALQGAVHNSLPMLQAAAENLAKDYGELHPHMAAIYREVAKALVAGEQFAAGREYLQKAAKAEKFSLIETLKSTSRLKTESTAAELREFQSLFLYLMLKDPSAEPAAMIQAFEYVQMRKAIETRALILHKPGSASVQTITPPWKKGTDYTGTVQELAEKRKQLLRIQISKSLTAGESATEPDQTRLQRETEELEEEIAGATSTWKLDFELLSGVSRFTAGALPPESAVIDYVVMVKPRQAWQDDVTEPRYLAFVLKPGTAAPKLFDLGHASAIDQAIGDFNKSLTSYAPQPSGLPDWMKKGRIVYNRLVKPLSAELSGVKHIYVAPDGPLSTLSFEVLPLPDDRLMIDEHKFSYLWLADEVHRFSEFFTLVNDPLVIAAPYYNLNSPGSVNHPPPASEQDYRINQLRHAEQFTELPSALTEGELVARKLGTAQLLTAAQATESALKKCQSPEIIHIATHGFYLEKSSVPETGTDSADYLQARARLDDSMERSGLAFAGANAYLKGKEIPAEAEDGILFASEVVDLDLRATDLVALIACQTGLGDIKLGDGIHGLRRGFKAAGARSILCALWKIPDQVSMQLVDIFYDRLLQGVSRVDALYQAKAEIRKDHPSDPFYWGGIILDGDPGPLRRFNPASRITIGSVNFREWGLNDLSEKDFAEKTPDDLAQDYYWEAIRKRKESDYQGAIVDLTSAIAIDGISDDVRSRCLYERGGIYRGTGQLDTAKLDYHSTLQLKGMASEIRLAVIYDRGTTHSLAGEFAAAVEDYSTVLDAAALSGEGRVKALVNRGYAYLMLAKSEAAIADLSAVINTSDVSRDQKFKALLNRSTCYMGEHQYEAAVADVTLALTMEVGESREIPGALYNRAVCLLHVGNIEGAIDDLNALVSDQNAPGEMVASALEYRAFAFERQGEVAKARADYESLLARRDTSDERAAEIRAILKKLK